MAKNKRAFKLIHTSKTRDFPLIVGAYDIPYAKENETATGNDESCQTIYKTTWKKTKGNLFGQNVAGSTGGQTTEPARNSRDELHYWY